MATPSLSPNRLLRLLKSHKDTHTALSLFYSAPPISHSPSIYLHLIRRLSPPSLIRHIPRLLLHLTQSQSHLPEDVPLAALKAFSSNSMVDDALHLFNNMNKLYGCDPGVRSHNCMLNCLVEAREWIKAESFLEYFEGFDGLGFDLETYNVLLKMFCRRGRFEKARQVLEWMWREGMGGDVFSYGTLISGFVKGGRLGDALEVFDEMRGRGVVADVVCYNVLINGCFKGVHPCRFSSNSLSKVVCEVVCPFMMRRKPAREIPSIPPEIMFQILILLPFESILACRLASKEWKDIINHPSFFNRYDEKPLALFTSENNFYCIIGVHGKKIMLESRIPIIDSNLQFENSSHFMASNGMTCVEDRNADFLLYNLFSGASYVVKNTVLGKWENTWYNGFGYDAYDDDYKIFVTRGFEQQDGLAWIYSVRNRVWNTYKGTPRIPYESCEFPNQQHQPYRRACFLSGALHWILRPYRGRGFEFIERARDSYKPIPAVILSYTLHTRKFHLIAFPLEDDGNKYCFGTRSHSEGLVELGGLLGFWRNEGMFQVWVMKHYRVNESWVLWCTINPSRIGSNVGFWNHNMRPTMLRLVAGDGCILFVCPNHYGWLFMCAIKGGHITDLQKIRVRVAGRLLGTFPT